MLKKLALASAALLICTASLFAGDCASGTDCSNACPLAQQANTRLATGDEALAVASMFRKDFVETVLANLAAI